jgi:acetyl esterase/lipase
MRHPEARRSDRFRGWLLAAALLSGALFMARQAVAAEPPPLSTFFSNADIAEARLSPSGRSVALIVAHPKTGRRVLGVFEVGGGKPPVIVASDPDADVRSFSWVNDERLVYNVIDLQSGGYDQNFGPGLFSVKSDGSEARQLIRVDWSGSRPGVSIIANVLDPDHVLLDVPQDGGNEVLVGQVQLNSERDVIGIVPKRLDVATGRARAALPNYPGNVVDWIFDRHGEARVMVQQVDGVSEVSWRGSGDKDWRSLGRSAALDRQWYPIAVDESDRLYVSSGASLRRFDFDSGRPDANPIATTPGFEVSRGLVFDAAEHKTLAGLRVQTDAETTVWFDPAMKHIQALADARFPNRVNRIVCRDCSADRTILVESYSDRDPGTFALLQPKTGEWTIVGRERRAVDPRAMATLDFFRAKARDGGDLPVWVTTPLGKADTPRPAVVLVHGGPWLRGTYWRWNADAQFLASRGYVVIEPEYRGSTGYGREHFRAGFRKWGTTMQDDVADAVRWAADKGLVDSKRVCIAGASYGGYATLMGAIRYPDLYRCGVAWVAVTDPRLLFDESWRSDMSREAREFALPTLIGDPAKDAEMLSAAAPVERAKEIRIPILMAFGGRDRRVPIDHGKRMRAAMQAAGQQPEYLVYSDEGHGWLKVENRIDFWTQVEKFLDKNLH